MYCGQCGTHNNEEAGHCETCGAPLLITAGARTCATCGSILGDNDRYCPSCGASTEDALLAESYDATDDFGDLNIDDIEITDLPDWLQEMAPRPEPPPQRVSSDTPTPDDLPDWLRDPTPVTRTEPRPATGQAQTGGSGVEHQPADQFSLVSDEDLPDWLKALGEEEPEPQPQPQPRQQPAAQRQEPQSTSAVATLFDIPPVTRAWLAHGRQIDPSQVSMAQQEFSPLETVSAPASPEASSGGLWDTQPIQTGMDEFTPDQRSADSVEERAYDRGRIIRIVTLSLLIVAVLVLAFILIQGV